MNIRSKLLKKSILDKKSFSYFKFKSTREDMSKIDFFNFSVLMTVGICDEIKEILPDKVIDLVSLLILTSLAKNEDDARFLIDSGKINIGEECNKTSRSIQTYLIDVKDPLNTLLTINKNFMEWAFVIFEE